MSQFTCSRPGCEREHRARGLCKQHYKRALKKGVLPPLVGRRRPPRGIDYLPDENGCWIWQKSLSSTGYGNYSFGGGKVRGAHRVIYEQFRGPIPKGLTLDHLCRVRACVNPDHLEPVTQAENNRRARRRYCKRGHDQTIHSYRRPDTGSTMCHACMLLRTQWRRDRRAA